MKSMGNLWEKYGWRTTNPNKSQIFVDVEWVLYHVFQWCQVVKSNPIKVPIETWRNIENPDSLVFFDGWQFVWRWKEQRICQTPAETDLKQEATWSCHVMFQKSCFKKCVSNKYKSDRENLVFGCSSHHSNWGFVNWGTQIIIQHLSFWIEKLHLLISLVHWKTPTSADRNTSGREHQA